MIYTRKKLVEIEMRYVGEIGQLKTEKTNARRAAGRLCDVVGIAYDHNHTVAYNLDKCSEAVQNNPDHVKEAAYLFSEKHPSSEKK
ncbi:MAG: hypothetical protein A2098_02710 [Chlamydiae bacterium GWF2_49_8]|nr:MAG: hypothetical protein A2098_02710 [Chlamydiae bacterium GWF2_49_8]